MSDSMPTTIDLRSRLALRTPEAAAALGLSERKFRQIASRLPTVWIDSVKLFPVDALRGWLQQEAERQQATSDQVASAVLREISGGRNEG